MEIYRQRRYFFSQFLISLTARKINRTKINQKEQNNDPVFFWKWKQLVKTMK